MLCMPDLDLHVDLDSEEPIEVGKKLGCKKWKQVGHIKSKYGVLQKENEHDKSKDELTALTVSFILMTSSNRCH